MQYVIPAAIDAIDFYQGYLGGSMIGNLIKNKQSGMPARTPSRARTVSRGRRKATVTPPRTVKRRKTTKGRSTTRSRSSRRGKRDITRTSGVSIMGTSHHSGIGAVSLYCNLSKNRKASKSLGNWVTHQSYAESFNCTAGRSMNGIILNILNRNDLLSERVTGGVNQGLNGNNARSLFSLNPYSNATGSSDASGNQLWGASKIINADKIHLKKVEFEIDMSNFSNVATSVEIMVYLCMKDSDRTVNQQAQAIMGGSEIGTTTAFNFNTLPQVPTKASILSGVPIATNFGQGYTTYVGGDYGRANGLSKWWKLCALHHMDLAAAASQKFKGSLVLDKVLDQKLVLDTVTKYIKGYSIQVCIRGHGQVVQDVTGGVTELPTYASAEVGCVSQEIYYCGAVKNNAARTNLELFSINHPIDTANADQQFIATNDIESSVIQAGN